ncbi:uncharacterized protein IAS62_003259 [Cryptococcus decagattii]|uniref:Uncharacterized protein n=1 Tax=Cryptococcus decagattii TaxID=1859122 RepID=A0ABZ2ATZ7_9TREE
MKLLSTSEMYVTIVFSLHTRETTSSGGNTRRYGGWRLGCHTLLRPSRPVTLVCTYILTSNSQPTCASPQPTSPPVRPVLRIHLRHSPRPTKLSHSLKRRLNHRPVLAPPQRIQLNYLLELPLL